jgi:hypothetical protein
MFRPCCQPNLGSVRRSARQAHREHRALARSLVTVTSPPSCVHEAGLQALVAKFLQNAFAQKIGIALTGLGKFDDALGDGCIGHIATIRKAKGHASHFEGYANNPLSFGVEIPSMKGVIGMTRSSILRRERDRSLSHRCPIGLDR